MKLTLSPMRGVPGEPETAISVSGDTITVDGTPYDLSAVPEGGEATPAGEHPFAGRITRAGGEIVCTVRVVLGDDAAPHQPTDPAVWTVRATDGPVAIPAVRKPEPEEPADDV
jgi:hypothetical protein